MTLIEKLTKRIPFVKRQVAKMVEVVERDKREKEEHKILTEFCERWVDKMCENWDIQRPDDPPDK